METNLRSKCLGWRSIPQRNPTMEHANDFGWAWELKELDLIITTHGVEEHASNKPRDLKKKRSGWEWEPKEPKLENQKLMGWRCKPHENLVLE